MTDQFVSVPRCYKLLKLKVENMTQTRKHAFQSYLKINHLCVKVATVIEGWRIPFKSMYVCTCRRHSRLKLFGDPGTWGVKICSHSTFYFLFSFERQISLFFFNNKDTTEIIIVTATNSGIFGANSSTVCIACMFVIYFNLSFMYMRASSKHAWILQRT